MLGYALRRLGWAIALTLLMSLVTFVLFFVLPAGDPAAVHAGPHAPAAVVVEVRHNLGLDRSLPYQYGHFLERLVLHLDLGYSYTNGQSVRSEISGRLAATLSLALGACVLWVLAGFALGVLAASRRRGLVDRLIAAGALLAASGPLFVLGYVLLFVFGADVGKLPLVSAAGSYVPFTDDPGGWADSLVLPWIALALPMSALYARLTRSAIVDALGEDYIRTARAKGLRERRVLVRHGARTALVPVVTLLGLDLGQVLGGVVFIEAVFNIPGLGTLAVTAIAQQDLPTIQGVVLVGTFAVVAANLAVDLLHARLDPRVTLGAREDW